MSVMILAINAGTGLSLTRSTNLTISHNVYISRALRADRTGVFTTNSYTRLRSNVTSRDYIRRTITRKRMTNCGTITTIGNSRPAFCDRSSTPLRFDDGNLRVRT